MTGRGLLAAVGRFGRNRCVSEMSTRRTCQSRRFWQSILAMAEAGHKGLSLLVVIGSGIPIDVVGVAGGILEFFESRLEFVMSSLKIYSLKSKSGRQYDVARQEGFSITFPRELTERK